MTKKLAALVDAVVWSSLRETGVFLRFLPPEDYAVQYSAILEVLKEMTESVAKRGEDAD